MTFPSNRSERHSAVTREVSWPMGHRLKNHNGPCRLAHGHNYVARVTAECRYIETRRPGKPDDGMVLDFADLDAAVRAIIARWDHAFMVEDGDPLVTILAGEAELVIVNCPPTAENIAWLILDELRREFGKATRERILIRRVEVHEGQRSVAIAEEVG